MQNLETLRQLFLGDLADDGRESGGGERREKIMPSLMATLLRWRTHSARTNTVPARIPGESHLTGQKSLNTKPARILSEL